jgi:hypothetical protein
MVYADCVLAEGKVEMSLRSLATMAVVGLLLSTALVSPVASQDDDVPQVTVGGALACASGGVTPPAIPSAGGSVVVTGSGFYPGIDVTITVLPATVSASTPGGPLPQIVATDESGEFSVTVTVSAIPAGTTSIQFVATPEAENYGPAATCAGAGVSVLTSAVTPAVTPQKFTG